MSFPSASFAFAPTPMVNRLVSKAFQGCGFPKSPPSAPLRSAITRRMVVAYVRIYSSPSTFCEASSRIHALLLPSADRGTIEELCVRPSSLDGDGTFPVAADSSLNWDDVADTPALLPYFGMETVVKDACDYNALMRVLRGDFECVTVAELQAQQGNRQSHVEQGLYAIPRPARSLKTPLPPETPLLQIKAARGRAHYLLADDVHIALHLVGERAHLFDLLCAHEKHER